MSSEALFRAFATVPRERFLGPGPWLIMGWGERWTTEEADPRHVYHDTPIALDEVRHINNGQPSLWAYHLDRLQVRAGEHVLHLGCGTGYYTAIMAEVVGPLGRVVAMEIDEALAERARGALAPWAQATVVCGDGASGPFDATDAIVVSAGATHPLPAWLAAMKPGGRLLFPLTSSEGPGTMARLTRRGESVYAARLNGSVAFIEFQGARDVTLSRQLAEALVRDHGEQVRSLRRDVHDKDKSCWLHGGGWCFSRREAEEVPG